MKVRLERDVLAEAVQWAARSLPLRPSVPILAGLLVRADAEGVTFSSFDYETSAQIHVTAAVADEGIALVSGRLLADISRSLPPKPVDITSDETRMELICGSARFTLQTLPVADYPSLPKMPEATGTVPSAAFAQAVGQVVVAAGRDELLPVFTGVRVEIDGDTISLLATDRYRMALRELAWNPSSTQISATALVPAMVLSLAFNQHRAQATSLAAIVPIAIVGAVIFGAADSLDLPAAILLAIGSLVGVQVGARLMHRLSAEWLSRIFGVFLLTVAIIMLVK